jgi:Zn-dependent protease with chaperone function
MNFFEHQDRAHQRTQQLIGLFLLSVLVIIATVYATAIVIYGMTHKPTFSRSAGLSAECLQRVESYPGQVGIEFDARQRPRRVISLDPATKGQNITQQVCPEQMPPETKTTWWNPSLFWLVAISTSVVIGGGSWFKVLMLRQGGAAIALELGGRIVLPELANPAEKQLLNVVEEMAIAAGIRVPSVYVLDHESGINAFAAGFAPEDAVIGVTRGCLETLTRDELQGVIGHEFSHIFNGDMRLNLRLVGLLHGILLIYVAGRILVEIRSSDDKHNFWFLGLALMAIGSLGLLCGRLIKSAVSRQREFLADASAVQFTRNPDGLASALDKIANHRFKAFLVSPHAETHSHLFFGSALRFGFWEDLFATHPPLNQRIKRLQGQSQRIAAPSRMVDSSAVGLTADAASALVAGCAETGFTASSPPSTRPVNPQTAAQIPFSGGLQAATQDSQSTIAIVYCLVLDLQNADLRSQQLEWLGKVDPDAATRTQELFTEVSLLPHRDRLPLLMATIPTLQQQALPQIQQLFKGVRGLALMDDRWSLSEFIVQLILSHQLRGALSPNTASSPQFETIGEIWQDCLVVMAMLAKAGQTAPSAIAYAFRSGVLQLPEARQQTIPEEPPIGNLTQLKKSLDRLGCANSTLQQAIVKAGVAMVLLDNLVTDQEAELLFALAIVLDVPPPACLRSGLKQPAKVRR